MAEIPTPRKTSSDSGKILQGSMRDYGYSIKWLVAGWLLAAILAILALYEAISAGHARNQAAFDHMQADIARADAAQLRQQLEAERILATREITELRQQVKSGAPTAQAQASPTPVLVPPQK